MSDASRSQIGSPPAHRLLGDDNGHFGYPERKGLCVRCLQEGVSNREVCTNPWVGSEPYTPSKVLRERALSCRKEVRRYARHGPTKEQRAREEAWIIDQVNRALDNW